MNDENVFVATLEPQSGEITFLSGNPLPSVISNLGDAGIQRFIEFFTAEIENLNTQDAYGRDLLKFFNWCEAHNLTLQTVRPFHIATYIDKVLVDKSNPTRKRHLAAIRKFYDYLVVGQIVSSNPSLSVRGPKHRQKKGKTPVLTKEEAKMLFNSFDTSTIIGLRDRALAATMFYSMGRVSAVINMKVKDFYPVGEIYKIRLYEKGSHEHEMPVHHTLERYIKAYIEKANLAGDKNALLFRSCGKGKANNDLLEKPFSRQNAWAMVRKRAKQAGIKREICNHSFRASGITIYMENGGELHKAQEMANHASIKTTAMYDHSEDKNTIDEVERIML